jgi:replicative DNA helicase
MTDMLSEALYYASRGWYVFPCREKPGASFLRNGVEVIPTEKTPYTSKGLNDATIDEEQIRAWWDMWQDAMIGVNCGMSGLFVVDIDRKHVNGLEVYSDWGINDNAGLHSITPSGGMHIVFKGFGKTSTNAKTGIDTRGEGGYFIAPPSKILEGDYTGEYKRFDDWSRTPGIIPDGLMSKLFPDNTTEYVRGISNDGWEKKQLSRASLTFLADGASVGERNSTLFKVLSDFVGCGYTEDECRKIVYPTCKRIGLEEGEFEQVLAHAFSKPRTSSIPDSIQEKLREVGRKPSTVITMEEQKILENAILACMLDDNKIIPVINDILSYDDFYVLQNKVIYRTINKLFNSGMKVDYVTLTSEISKETDKVTIDEVMKLKGMDYVIIENVSTYASIIKEKASVRKLESLMDNKDTYLRNGTFIEVVSKLEKDIANIALYGGAKSQSVLTAEQATIEVAERTKKLASGEIELVKTGFETYDYRVGGFYPGDLIMIAGRAGEGKSAMGLSIANNVGIARREPVGMFNLEMSTHETVCRLISQLTGLEYRHVYMGKLDVNGWKKYEEAMDKIASSKIFFDDTPYLTVPELRSKIRKLMNENIKLFIIDQLEQMRGYEGLAPHIRYNSIAYDIKSIAKEFEVPIILNHQLNRAVTDRKLNNPEPELSDLNQAGEKPTNQVWAIIHKRDEDGNIMTSKIKMLKNRNGVTINFPVKFVGERMLFTNPADDDLKREAERQNRISNYDYSTNDEEPFWAK